ncbi:MAG TPA: molybdopterin cofactor-binding domain-containing protein, partial [Hyphomicrobiaceae bacterium]|nr:molybdopterin cofactor-binding domain-containing protein [Hyphomicrobiaceae bacterium]
FNGAVDIGQGSSTVLLQIAADALGLPPQAFDMVVGDTDLTEDAGKTSASRQTFVSGNAARLAAADLRRKILALANAGPDARLTLEGARLTIADGEASRTIDLGTLPVLPPRQADQRAGRVERSDDPQAAPVSGAAVGSGLRLTQPTHSPPLSARSNTVLRGEVENARPVPETAIMPAQAGTHASIRAHDDSDVLEGTGHWDPPTTPLDADGQGVPYATYGFAAQMAEVEVDTVLGTTKVLAIVAAHDVGRAINPTLVEGQIHGGIAQGLGMALMEEFTPGRTENLHDYLIPTAGDVPPIKTYLIEDTDPHGPFGAKGVGEPALIATAPAILSAIRHATGARLTRTPVLPHRLWQALRELRGSRA